MRQRPHGDVLRHQGQGMIVRGHQVDHGLYHGIEQLQGEHQGDGQGQQGPLRGADAQGQPQQHGERGQGQVDAQVALRLPGVEEAPEGVAEAVPLITEDTLPG